MMQQDPKKEPKDYKKPSVKDRLKRDSAPKKAPVKQVGEMGKPSLKAEFEADMQKERDFVLNRAKIREEARDAAEKMGRGEIMRMAKDIKGGDYPATNIEEFSGWMNKQKNSAASELKRKSEIIKAMKPLKSMSKPKEKY
jgi:hypothetical protein